MNRMIFLCFMLLCSTVWGQEHYINFEKGTFAEALALAKKENKLLFVDCYTVWCGPCKMLDKNIFTDSKVANYFNKDFISLKIDCEKGEGPEIAKKYGVSGYPTLLFINGDGEVVNKMVGASRTADMFIAGVKKGLDPETSLYAKEKKYNNGNRDRQFVLDLIRSYREVNESKKATQVSKELLEEVESNELCSEEMWNVMSYYYVSSYGSKWWDYIIENSDRFASIVGQEIVAKKIGETMHPYLFGYIYGRKKATKQDEFKTYKELVNKYNPPMKGILDSFIELGESWSFDDFDGYFKTVCRVIPKLDKSEHYRFFANAFEMIYEKSTPKQRKRLMELLQESQKQQNEYIANLYSKFYDRFES